MTILKRICALLLALMLCTAPLMQVYAEGPTDVTNEVQSVSSDPIVVNEEVPTDPTEPAPTDPTEPDPTEPTEPSEPLEELVAEVYLYKKTEDGRSPFTNEWTSDSKFDLLIDIVFNRDYDVEVDGELQTPEVFLNLNQLYPTLYASSATSATYIVKNVSITATENEISASAYNASVSVTVHYDADSPVMSNDFSISNVTYDSDDNALYVKGSINIKGTFIDPTSGVKKISKYVGTVVESEVYSGNFDVNLLKSDLQEVHWVVYDNADNSTTYTPKQLIEVVMGKPDGWCDTVQFIFDSVSPDINYRVVSEDTSYSGNGYTYYKTASFSVEVSDDVLLDSASCSVNGVQVASSVWVQQSSTVWELRNIPLSQYGVNTIEIVALDMSGNVSSKSFSVFIDDETPEKGTLGVEGTYEVIEGKIYTDGTLKITGVPVDTGSGVKSLKVYKYDSDSQEVVATELPYTVQETGSYYVLVEDNLGISARFDLKDLIEDASDNAVYVENESPTIEYFVKQQPVYAFNDNNYYNGDTTFVVKTNYKSLRQLKISINGTVVSDTSYQILQETDPVRIEIPVTDINGKISVSIYMCGIFSVNNYSYTYYNDTLNPVLGSLKATGDFVEKDGYLYVDGSLQLKGTPFDMPEQYNSGIKSIEILKDGTVIDGAELPYTITESGAYSIKVTDNVGNFSVWNLKDLLEGATSNTVIIDNDAPALELSVMEDPAYINDSNVVFYSGDTNVHISVTEENLDVVSVYINDEDPLLFTDLDFLFNIKGIVGQITVRVVATDLYGHSTEKTLSYVNDMTPPSIGSLCVDGNYELFDGIICSDGTLSIKGDPEDTESGIASIELYKVVPQENNYDIPEDELIVSMLPYTFDTAGQYYLKVTDNVGNITIFYMYNFIEELSEEDTCYITLNTEVPDVSISVKEEAVYVNNQTSYYNGDTTVVISVNDPFIKHLVVKINGEIRENFSYEFMQEVEPYSFEVPVSGINGRVEVELLAENIFNNANKTYIYVNDQVKPEKGTLVVNGTFVEKNGNLYVENELVVSGSPKELPEDANSGIYKVEVLKNGVVVGTSLPYSIVSSGVYTVRATDNVGNVETWGIKDLLEGANSSTVVIDNVDPSITLQIEQLPVYTNESGKNFYNGDTTLNVSVVENNIDVIDVYINGEKVQSESVLTFNVPVEGISGEINIRVVAKDFFGHEVQSTISYVNDTTVPEIGTVKATGNFIENAEDMKLYVKEYLSIDGAPTDLESGVNKVEVLNGSTVVSDSLPYSIRSNGTYLIRVTDNVGNVKTWALKDILEGANSSTVVIDGVSPVITPFVDPSDKPVYKDSNEKDWYNKTPVFTFEIADDNILDVVVKVGDTTLSQGVTSSNKYTIDMSQYTAVKNSFNVTAVDKAGNVATYAYSYCVDTVPVNLEELQLIVTGTKMEYSGVIYTNGAFKFTGSVHDAESGLREFTILKDGAVVYTNNNGAVNYTIDKESQSGVYSVKAIDNCGNEITLNAGDLLNSQISDLCVDLTNPVIKRVDSNSETVAGWYNYAPTLEYSVNDANLNTFVVKVNGDEVVRKTGPGTYSVDTSKYQNMAVLVEVTAVDKAGNSSQLSYSYSHDNAPPSNLTASAEAPKTNVYGNAYYWSPVSVSYNAIDNGYGKITYHIVNAEGKELNIQEALSTGAYRVYAVDGLGNASAKVELGTLLGWNGNNLIVDTDEPVVSGVKLGGVWKNAHATYSLSSSDKNGIAKYTVSINGKSVKISELSSIQSPVGIDFDTTKSEMNNDGSYNIEVHVWDNAGREVSWSDIYYLDTVSPEISAFVLNGTVNSIGNAINGEDKYGFFFNGNGTVTVKATDSAPSSGLDAIWVKLTGGDWKEYKVSADGSVIVSVPADYKGVMEAYAVDKVANKGNSNKPDLIISETNQTHVNNTSIRFVLPETPYKDASGHPLYNKDVTVSAELKSTWAGIKGIEYSVNKGTAVTGTVAGSQEKNIVIMATQAIPVSLDINAIPIEITVADWSGYVSTESTTISIDKDAPVITVTYNSNNQNAFYKSDRVANITVKEVNFDPTQFKVGGQAGALGTWSSNGDIWTNTISFTADGDYAFTLDCTDRAGNVATQYKSEAFTVDKTAPVMTVVWSNDSARNVNYYDSDRIATVTINEHNFDPASVVLTGSGTIVGWNNSGDIRTATISFTEDGEYSFSLSCTDKAGNVVGQPYTSGLFIIDKTAPEIAIKGVTDGVSYKSNVGFIVELSDNYLDKDEISVVLTGKTHDALKINGEYNEKLSVYEFTDFPQDAEVDDSYTLSVVVKDKAGNETSETVNFSVNRFGSTYKFYDEAYLGTYMNEPKDIEISELNVDKLELDDVVVSITKDGKAVIVNRNWLQFTEEEINGKYLYTYKISKEAFMEDGKYSVSISSKSYDGTDYTCETEHYDFIIDGTPAQIIISGVEDNGNYRAYEKRVAIDIRDMSGINEPEVYLNGEKIKATESDGIYYITVKEQNHKQSIRVVVTDYAGNKSEVEVKDFLVTSNLFVYLMNQLWFKLVSGGVIAAVLAMLILLIVRRRKDRKAIRDQEAQELELRKTSTTGSSGSSGGNIINEDATVPTGEAVPNSPDLDTSPVSEESRTGTMDMGESISTDLME